ncbi:uncharacterized protein LOC132034159 [Lycium ferocissimum]|uniref:uncharacterized protein LOC132034159 n=1 Tax=Lycium ferocissimum TaxID=112874 RepID=UPI00281546D2|nr:uncharacterized protein LOC132034159 [Lycium ferocissimum]
MCKKWGARRLKLFNAVDDPLKSRDHIRAEAINKVPDGIPWDQWISYVDYCLKGKTGKCATKKRKFGRHKPFHTSVAPNPTPEEGMKWNEDGSYVNEAAKEICVLGKEHSGGVRCLGLGAIPSRAFKQTRPRYSDLNASTYNSGSCSSQWQEKYNQTLNAHNKSQDNLNFLMNAHTEMMSTFKVYMIRKEGRIPEEFIGIFVSTTPPSTPNDAASGHVSPTDVRRSFGCSNSNDNQ